MSDLLERPAEAPGTALAVTPASAVSTIVAADKDDLLGKIARKVAAFKPDVSTAHGRDEMRSLAYEISKTKTALIKIGKGLTEAWRKSTKAVNDECNVLEQRMDELRDKVREQLTAWEDAEKAREAAHEQALRDIQSLAILPTDHTSEDVRSRLAELDALPARDWQLFRDRASDAVATTTDKLAGLLIAAERREAEAAELTRLRAAEQERQREEAARQQAEHERKIAAEAAERARLAAEAEAQRLIAEERAKAAAEQERAEREARQAAEALERAEREKREAEDRAQRLADEAEAARVRGHEDALTAMDEATNVVPGSSSATIKATLHAFLNRPERDWQEFADKATDLLAAGEKHLTECLSFAEKRETAEAAKQAEAQRKRDDESRTAAIETERQRVAAQQAAEAEATRKREANVAHKKRINGEVLADIVAALAHTGVDYNDGPDVATQIAKAIITAAAKGQIRHVSVAY